ncbi:porin [Grimontia hollisae]|uniref:Porin OmpF n=1 Tax=Grimontia hollisae TaxID=673 RepID=A0A377J6Z3_GRIHO|nr:porin [Grimontia hollisae]MDF2186664.1 porin [Grimontia hollisae]STO98247.1 Porin OmpF [Grimontia hollisae]
MNKTLLAVVLSSLVAGTAQAATIYKNDNGDNIKVYGGAEVGGTFVSDTDKTPFGTDTTYVDQSFATIGLKGQTGNFYGKFEVDAEREDWTADNNLRLAIDKIMVGFKFADHHALEFGRTDTAYDKVDSFGDMSNELGAGISEAGDQDNTIRYIGNYGSIKLSVSHSLEGWDGETVDGEPVKYSYKTDSLYGAVTNGYIGYYGDDFTVILGGEKGKETEIYSAHAEMEFDNFTLGGLVFDQTKNFNGGKDKNTIGANIGGKYALNSKTNLIATFNYEDTKGDADANIYGVFGADYMYAKNVKLAAEIAAGDVLDKGESGALMFVKAFYWF